LFSKGFSAPYHDDIFYKLISTFSSFYLILLGYSAFQKIAWLALIVFKRCRQSIKATAIVLVIDSWLFNGMPSFQGFLRFVTLG